ncbi:MAG: hypothetical protein K0V04_30320 [Deltaproteobacteria bacterium]|nr:hypothetical protein [Deltaproteobacteria bacterium]
MTTAMIMGVCVLVCLAVVAAPLPSSDMLDPESSRAKFNRRAEARLAATVFALAMLACGVLMALERGATWPIVPLAVLAVGGMVALHPWLAVRWICIPLGLPRLAVTMGRLGGHPWVRDPEGGAVLSGVLAQLRRPLDAPMNDWLRARLRRGPLRGAGLVAAGLLAADGGDRVTARALLASIDDLDPALCPPLARRIALEWRIADAARNGDWALVATLTEDGLAPSRTVRLMAALARHHRGETADTAALWRAWAVAPRRRRTWSLIRGAVANPAHLQAIALEHVALVDDVRLAANDGGPAPREVLALHVEALVDGDAPGGTARMARLGKAWDRAMDDFGFRGHVRRRAESLRCTVLGEKVLARMHREVCEDMARMLTHTGEPADGVGDGLTATRSVAQMHTMALEELEQMCSSVTEPRPACATVSQVLEQWQAWLQVRTRYQALARVAAPEVRKDAYTIIELHLRQLMAWLWNDLGERGLANAISAWLLLEAERVHDEDSAAYHRHNVALVI